MRAPNFSRTYFCHRIPPLGLMIPRAAICDCGQACLRIRRTARVYRRGRGYRIQIDQSIAARLHGYRREPESFGSSPTALKAACQDCRENVGSDTGTCKADVTNRSFYCLVLTAMTPPMCPVPYFVVASHAR